MNDDSVNQLVRICPLCGKHNPADETFCVCGTLLADVDFTHLGSDPAPTNPEVVAAVQPAQVLVICPYSDCAQPSPPGSERCVYCNRLIDQSAGGAVDERQSFLPPALRAQFQVLEILPSTGGQADLAVVETALHEKRVVKLYRKGIKPDWQVLERLSAVDNRHLVRFIAHGDAEGVSYEVMEYCPEGTLRDLLDSGPQSADTVRGLVGQLSGALAALHARQILHRDLKPENILLRKSVPLDVALTDFGASSLKMATQYFTAGARTVNYSAPEVLTGVLDEKADWWSLGMVVLEAVTGRHPYAGLSEQVALHQLATQSVDVKEVFDDAQRMLCRGLLLRNPKRRWGAVEVARWLAGDESLVMPEDGSEGVAVRPYTLARAQCLTRIDLALALSRYWEEGKKDLMRGTVMNWAEHDLRDFNLARDIHDVLIRRDLSDDARVFRVILKALPGIPPIWKGKVITQESLARAATQAINDNMPALDWLLSIYKEDVLRVLGECGNEDMSRIAKSWSESVDVYRTLWERAKAFEEEWRRRPRAYATEVADIDYLMYLAPIRMSVPSLNRMVLDMVLALYVPAFEVSARNAVKNACAGLAERCSWYTQFVAEAEVGGGLFWSVAQRLLPFAIEDAEKEQLRQQQVVKNSGDNVRSVIVKIEDACKRLLEFEHMDQLEGWEFESLCEEVPAWIALSIWVRGLDHDNPTLRELSGRFDLVTMRVMDMQSFLDGFRHELDINEIWLKPSRLMFAAFLLLGVLAYSGTAAAVLLVLLGGGVYSRLQRVKTLTEEGLVKVRRMVEGVQQFSAGLRKE